MSGAGKNIKGGMYPIMFREESYDRLWIIPVRNLPKINTLRNLRLFNYSSEVDLSSQSFEFKIRISNGASASWLLGFQKQKSANNSEYQSENDFRVYWKLIEATGFSNGKVEATLSCSLLKCNSLVDWTYAQEMTMAKGGVLILPIDIKGNDINLEPWTNSNGELQFKLTITIKIHEASAELKMDQFHKASVSQVCANFASLLNDADESTADLKIVTSDEKELFAHRAILKVQCPVFDSMFRSDLSESKTGIVHVKDITAKTMRIFLHLFYSGELLSSWMDQDTVVEFAYAVGKYQLTNVLELLDEILGSRDNEDATYADIQLLALARKLNLKNAEKELVQRIKTTTAKVTSGEKLFELYGIGED